MASDKQKAKAEFAAHFFDMKCGPLNLEWAIDAYWGKVVKEVLRPTIVDIYHALVNRNITEDNKIYTNDADSATYYIPHQTRKVFVSTTQSRDFLYVYEEDKFRPSLHVRRIWREATSNKLHYKPSVMLKDIQSAINHADHLSEFADTTAQYVMRPGLQYYKEIDFAIPSDEDKYVGKNKSLRRTFGDFRDPGYVLSFEDWPSDEGIDYPPPRVEGSKYTFKDIEILATCFIPCLARELGIECRHLSGYEYNR